MSWFIAIAVGVMLALAVIFFLTTRHHGAGTVADRFNFDDYKESELSQRGVQDKTKRR